MGTPLLTLPQDGMHTRVGASYVANAGCPQLIAASLRQYEHVAVQLATRRASFDALRTRLARHRWTSAAFDTTRWVRAFDAGVRVVHTEAVLLLRAASAAAEANVVRATHRAAAMVWRP